MHQIHFLLGLRPRPLPLFKGPTSKGMEGTGKGEEKVKGKEGERWREGFGLPKNFGVAPLWIVSQKLSGMGTLYSLPSSPLAAFLLCLAYLCLYFRYKISQGCLLAVGQPTVSKQLNGKAQLQ